MRGHGYINRGGTLDAAGMLFANRSTWAHLVASGADLLGEDQSRFLTAAEVAAIGGCGDPRDVS